MKLFWILLLGSLCSGCTGPAPQWTATGPTIAVAPAPPARPAHRIALDWESGHPERAAWSSALIADVNAHYESLTRAGDMTALCPEWNSLSRAQRAEVLAEIFVWTAYYESGWDPRDYSVDVGSRADTRTWSVGLLQLSVVDQTNLRLPFGYSFEDLQDPIRNLNLAVAIMARQIDRRGRMLIPAGSPGVYWSTLHPGGKHDKSAEIASRIRRVMMNRMAD